VKEFDEILDLSLGMRVESDGNKDDPEYRDCDDVGSQVNRPDYSLMKPQVYLQGRRFWQCDYRVRASSGRYPFGKLKSCLFARWKDAIAFVLRGCRHEI